MVQHLKSKALFQAALGNRPSSSTRHFALHRVVTVGQTAPMIGVVIPKRWAKRAATRNLIKRHIYTMFVARSTQLAAATVVVRLRRPWEPAQFPSAQSRALAVAVKHELAGLVQGCMALTPGAAEA
ncbi:MAG: hypothetical protein RLZZ126_1761 [Pseudomonadota bacterium]|jgi:ribonuclease P protein component